MAPWFFKYSVAWRGLTVTSSLSNNLVFSWALNWAKHRYEIHCTQVYFLLVAYRQKIIKIKFCKLNILDNFMELKGKQACLFCVRKNYISIYRKCVCSPFLGNWHNLKYEQYYSWHCDLFPKLWQPLLFVQTLEESWTCLISDNEDVYIL